MTASLAGDTATQGYVLAYRRLRRRRLLLVAGLGILTIFCFCTDLVIGPAGLTPTQVFYGITDPSTLSPQDEVILWHIRLPYAAMAIGIGAALGLAGAETQTALNNPLASPYTLGISWAAFLGATLAIVFDWNFAGFGHTFTLAAAAFACAVAASLLILAVATRLGAQIETIVLFGIALLFTCSAIISLLQFVADAEDVQESVLWSMGSLTRADWGAISFVFLATICVVPFSLRAAPSLTLLRSGEEQARSAGLSVGRLRLWSFMRAALLTSAAIAFVGAIGFIGLVAPHIARLLVGEDHRIYLPAALTVGALLMSLASILSKLLITGVVIPVGIVTALVGIPIFVVLLFTRWRQR